MNQFSKKLFFSSIIQWEEGNRGLHWFFDSNASKAQLNVPLFEKEKSVINFNLKHDSKSMNGNRSNFLGWLLPLKWSNFMLSQ